MRYDNIHKGKFLSRPNRFIANVEIDGKAEVCHVKIRADAKSFWWRGVLFGLNIQTANRERPLLTLLQWKKVTGS